MAQSLMATAPDSSTRWRPLIGLVLRGLRLRRVIFLLLAQALYSAATDSNSSHFEMAVDKHKMPSLVPRDEWGAAPPHIWPRLEPISRPVKYILVSYFDPTITDDKLALQAIQKKHQAAGLCDIQSNFMVGRDGSIYCGRGWMFKPAKSIHFPKFDGKYYEIAYIGNFNDEKMQHPCYKATWDILEWGKRHNYITDDFIILSEKDKMQQLEK